MYINVEINKESKEWEKYKWIDSEFFSDITKNILSRYKNFSTVQEFELSLLFATKSRIMELNSKFRNKNKTTNILSFPEFEINYKNILEFETNNSYMYLGDIAFCCSVITNEAKNKLADFKNYLTHLTVHSILHLIGYDHINDDDAQIMELLENEILTSYNIK